MGESIWNVWSYKKTPVIELPETPQYFKLLLPATSSSSLLVSPTDLQESPSTTSLSPLGSPFDVLMDRSSSQLQLRQSHQTDEQKLAYKFEWMEAIPKDPVFDSLGENWKSCSIIWVAPLGVWSLRLFSREGCLSISQEQNKVKMSDITVLIYGHKHSAPSPTSPLFLSVMPHSLLLSLLLKYLMLILPYSHGQPTLLLYMSIRRSTSFLIQMFQVEKIIFKLLWMAAAWINSNW